MTTMTTATNTPSPSGDSYGDGYFDGELDALSKLPAAEATARASMADPHDHLWAQGYADGYLNQIQVTYALAQKEQAA
ncbi:hypothetical protein [Streptomyces bottropensis]|uniref:hypothetical protein n=1 Tax=Streptomyces bottropensis TaxID=42235 RepID=UPI0036C1C164